MISRARPHSRPMVGPWGHATLPSRAAGPRVAPVRARRPCMHPADRTTACALHAALSNHIHPLNLVDQLARGCGKGLERFPCQIAHSLLLGAVGPPDLHAGGPPRAGTVAVPRIAVRK